MDNPKKVTETVSEKVTQTVTEMDTPTEKAEEMGQEAGKEAGDPAYYHEINKNPADEVTESEADDEAPMVAWEEEEDET